MPTFSYTARAGISRVIEGQIEANDEADAAFQLRRRGLQPIECTEVEESFWKADVFPKRVSLKDRVIFTRQFATLIGSGMPIMQSLSVLAEQTTSEELKRVIRRIIRDIESGETLHEALRQHPKVFDNLYVAMVEAGEAGGILESILSRLAGFLEKADALQKKVTGALVYPVSVLAIAAICVAILMVKVVPIFADLFSSAKMPLPAPTKLVLSISGTFAHYWWVILLVIVTLVAGLKHWRGTPQGRAAIDTILLRLPVVGSLLRRAAVARFTRTLGTLSQSGVPILDGLDITAKAAGNHVIEQAIRTARAEIVSGNTIAGPLKESGQFPAMVCAMISVGEQTGGLDLMLLKIADFYDAEVEGAVDVTLKLMEPLMIVVLGTVIGGLVAALYAPIFGMARAATRGGI